MCASDGFLWFCISRNAIVRPPIIASGPFYSFISSQKPPPGKPDYKTIEGELFEALVRAGAVSKDNSNDPLKVNFARAARTDAGVHAAGNIVSLKMITSIPDQEESMVDRINRELPADIRVWNFVGIYHFRPWASGCKA